MSNEFQNDTRETADRIHDLGLVTHALEREAPKKRGALGRLAVAFATTSLSALLVPGCVVSNAQAPAPAWGLDNGTVGQVAPAPAAPMSANEEKAA